MNVDSILLSEHASTDQGGRLTVVNAFNQIFGPGPQWGIPVLAMSIVIHAHSAEAGTAHEGFIRLINEERTTLKKIPFEFTLSEVVHEGVPLRHIQTLTILGAGFDAAGVYAFEVYIDGTYHASVSLVIVQRDPR